MNWNKPTATYQRLVIGMVVAYAAVLGVALMVFVVVPAAKFWGRDAAPVSHRAATFQSAGAGGQPK